MFPVAAVGIAAALAYAVTSGPRNTLRMNGPDGHQYDMQNLPNKEGAVAMMSEIRSALVKLYGYYKDEPALAADPPVARFLQRFTPDVFVENDMGSKDTSYSENKGQRIVVCLRDKTKAPQYPLIDKNTVMFVILHERPHTGVLDQLQAHPGRRRSDWHLPPGQLRPSAHTLLWHDHQRHTHLIFIPSES